MATEGVEVQIMEKELYIAAMEGNVEFLEDHSKEYLLRKTQEKYNLLYIAIRYDQLEFIKRCLEKFPNNYGLLISDQENSNQNTSLHIAAEMGNLEVMQQLYNYYSTVRVEGDLKPWRLLKNSKGDTAVHVALVHCNPKIAMYLLDKDPEVAFESNYSKETPLHLALNNLAYDYAANASMMETISCTPEENEMKNIITFLVESGSKVASWPDSKGSTPLHKAAATLCRPYNKDFTKKMIEMFPESAQVCDANGKSILHLLINNTLTYQDARELVISVKQICALRNHQDHLGDTPLHTAAKKMDIIMVGILLESRPKLNICNKDGISPIPLILQQNMLQMKKQRRMTSASDLEAAGNAITNFLTQIMEDLMYKNEFSMSLDCEGRNILHILMEIKQESHIMKANFIDFIKKNVEYFPHLVNQVDKKGNTPIHILVGNDDHNITIYETHQQMNNNNDNNNGEKLSSLWQSGILSEILEICKDCIIVRNEQEEASNNNGGCNNNKLPWLVQNVEGNTPLHEAVIVKNRHLVVQLLKYNNNMSADVLFNKRRDTPLHLLAGASAYHHDGKERFNTEEVNLMAGGNEEAVFSLDRDGLTPILRAFRAGNLAIAATLCNISPEAAMISDKDGNTFLHLLVKHPSKYHLYCLLQNEALRSVWGKGDNKGNTALHLAINDSRFDIVQMFLDAAALDNQKLSQWLVDLLEIQNKAHKTPADLISDSPCLPPKIEESIWYEPKLLGVRSRWGVPTSQIKPYMNTVGVIAVLLATITFTTAFTIANAISKDIFDNEQELSMISHEIPFKLFMISDVTAMCLSMMVLVCLLKIMATNNKRNAIITLDFSIGLLRASFITTLMTFTMAMSNTLPDITVITVTLCLIVSLFLLNFGTMDIPMYVRLVVYDFTNLLFIIMSRLCRTNLRREANVEGTVRQIDASNNV